VTTNASDASSPHTRALPLRAQVLELRGLVAAKGAIAKTINERAQSLLDAGADRSQVAFALGISRAQLYRLYRLGAGTQGSQGRPGSVANP
jgi:DNA invertase Pin-like site-specific DNA recombinase